MEVLRFQAEQKLAIKTQTQRMKMRRERLKEISHMTTII